VGIVASLQVAIARLFVSFLKSTSYTNIKVLGRFGGRGGKGNPSTEGFSTHHKSYILHIKQEVHNVSVGNNVILAFCTHYSRSATGGFRFVLHKILVGDNFGTDKTLLKVCMNNPCRLRCLPPRMNRPSSVFLLARRKKADKT